MHQSSEYWISFCILLANIFLIPLPARGADQEMVRRMLVKLDKIPMVDTHSHVPLPMYDAAQSRTEGFRYNISWLLGNATYVGKFLYGKNWSETKKTLEINAHHAYCRPIRQALVDLYGLGPTEELNDSNVESMSARLSAKRRDLASWYDEVYQRANVRHVVWLEGHPEIAISPDDQFMQLRNPGNRLSKTFYHPMWNIDSAIVFIATQPTAKERQKTGFQYRIDQTEKRFGVKLRNLADMEAITTSKLAGNPCIPNGAR